jgi:chaperonin GroES
VTGNQPVRLGCVTCDRDDFDGISETALRALIDCGDWQEIGETDPDDKLDDEFAAWETHFGRCPDCCIPQKRLDDAMGLARKIGIRPLHDLVLVDCEPRQDKIGRFHLPDSSRDSQPSIRGTVLAIGRGRECKKVKYHLPLDVFVGDRVLIERWQGKEIEWQGHDLKLVKIGDVVGVLDE